MGAGIVADSDPEAEYEETLRKGSALVRACEVAARGLDGMDAGSGRAAPDRAGTDRGCRMILVIDNYDSFTYNLVQYLGELGGEPLVYRNDAITRGGGAPPLARAVIVLSPGPKSPTETERTNEIMRASPGKLPILGVCLGHQCIAHVYGGRVVRAARGSCTARPRW